MSEPQADSQNPVRRPRPRRRLALAAGALAVAVAIGCGVGVAAASTTHPAAASPQQAAAAVTSTGSAATSTTAPSTSGSGTAPTARTAPKARAGRAARVVRPRLQGAVTSVGSGTITIKDREGFLRQIKTSAKTVYKGKLKSPLAVGTQILARGTVDATGTSLDATIIRKAPAHAAGKRHHRRAKHGTAATRPSSKSAPSIAPSSAPTSASPTTS